MAKTLSMHEKSDGRKWAAVTIAILLIIAVIVAGVLTDWFTVKDKYCLFSHDYDESGKCIRCGEDKPAEEAGPTAALIASAKQLNSAADSQEDSTGQALSDDEQEEATLFSFDGLTCSGTNSNFDDDIITVNDKSYALYEIPNKVRATSLNIGCFTPNTSSIKRYRLFRKDGSSDWYKLPNNGTAYSITDAGKYFFKDITANNKSYYQSNEYAIVFEKLLVDNPVKTGYTFTGWYTDEACTQLYTSDVVTGDTTLYAGFEPNVYKIVFIANGGSGEMDELLMTYGTAQNLPANTFEYHNHKFVGWGTKENLGHEVVYSDGEEVLNLTAENHAFIELVAVYERTHWDVRFISDESIYVTKSTPVNTAVDLPESDPVKDHYNFVRWELADGITYTNQAITADTTLTAVFKIVQHTVTFVCDGEELKSVKVDYGTPVSSIFERIENKLMFTASAELLALSVENDMVIPVEKTGFGSVVSQPWVKWTGVALAGFLACAIIVGIVLGVKKKKR